MPDDNAHDSGFRVVDRRPFSGDGTRRENAEKESEKPEARKAPPAPSRATDREPEEYLEPEPSGFETLVEYLSTTAMFQLGLLQGPGGERIPPDLLNARLTIDMLDVLREKTQGNLTPAEQHFLEDALYKLRLSYVEVEKRGAPKKR
jgi:uncharacterized protein DUF1844